MAVASLSFLETISLSPCFNFFKIQGIDLSVAPLLWKTCKSVQNSMSGRATAQNVNSSPSIHVQVIRLVLFLDLVSEMDSKSGRGHSLRRSLCPSQLFACHDPSA